MSSKKIFILSLLVTITIGFFCINNLALAQTNDFGLGKTAIAAGLDKTGPASLPDFVGNVLGTALSFIGVLFFALMVFGGFMWMTARGNDEQTKKAMSTITAAVIGLVIVLSSYTITTFVFKSVGVQSGGGTTGGGQVTSNPCATPGFTCNLLSACENITTTSTSFTDKAKVENECKSNGTGNCENSDSCPQTSAKGYQVCCKAKTTQANWCYINGVCASQGYWGTTNCFEGMNSSTTTWNPNGTEAGCYTKALTGATCSSDSDCKKDMTKLVCGLEKKCVAVVLSTSTVYSDTQKCDAKLSTYPDRDWDTVSDSALGGQCNCSSIQTPGGVCKTSADCKDAGAFCIKGKCETGKTCARCDSQLQCALGYFCEYNTIAVASTCFPKTTKGGKCDEDYHCQSGACIDTNGVGGPDTCN